MGQGGEGVKGRAGCMVFSNSRVEEKVALGQHEGPVWGGCGDDTVKTFERQREQVLWS